jgi:hypothetical protein
MGMYNTDESITGFAASCFEVRWPVDGRSAGQRVVERRVRGLARIWRLAMAW